MKIANNLNNTYAFCFILIWRLGGGGGGDGGEGERGKGEGGGEEGGGGRRGG